MDDIKEPILCAPNDPDDARLLSEVMGEKVDEVFIGSYPSPRSNQRPKPRPPRHSHSAACTRCVPRVVTCPELTRFAAHARSCMTNIGHFRAAGKMLESFEGQVRYTGVTLALHWRYTSVTAKMLESFEGQVGCRGPKPSCRSRAGGGGGGK